MGNKTKLKIGEFSKMMQVTVKTLRYIDEHGNKVVGHPRTCYIDGAWNQDDPEKWLSVIQIPIE